MEKIFKKIIGKAVWAASGDNSQPWRFVLENDGFYIFNLSDRDIPLYNWGQRGSLVAHGGLIENVKILASQEGYETKVNLFPDPDETDLVAQISLEKSEKKREPLADFIRERATNRRPYQNSALTDDQRQQLLMTVDEIGAGRLILLEDPAQRKLAAEASSVNEIIVLETPELHRQFFRHVVWTEKEERAKRTGLYVKTLEMTPPQELIFKLFSHWRAAQILNKLGFSKLVAKSNAELYATGAAMGAIIFTDNRAENFVLAGRLLQRLWLKATQMGMSLHPITGVLFLMQRILAQEVAGGLKPEQVEMIGRAHQKIVDLLGIRQDQGTIAMFFRLGFSQPPSAHSSRLQPEIVNLQKTIS
ncbi:MAG: hypothetical protein HY577_00955 [Candidatus Nealsonbacteria bacterium]|nr:hypothetical protein [Candidatus Nealsonbacteria bacterium]